MAAQPENPTPDTNDNPQAKPATAPATDATTSTQSDMGDGAGIRGDYGNASQTNGLEGGPEEPAEAPVTEE